MSTMEDDRILAPMLARLAELIPEDDPEFARELISIYLAETPRQIDQIKAGIEKNDAQVVAGCAHSLKSASANFGFDEMVDLSKQLEVAGRTGSLDGAGALVARLETVFQELISVLARFAAGK